MTTMINDAYSSIPSVTPCEAIEEISLPLIAAIKTGGSFNLKTHLAPFLWGASGIGKSDSVFQLADIVSQKTGKKVIVTDVRLLSFTPADIMGIPFPDIDKRFTKWLMPKIFDMNPSEDVINILFLDELSAAHYDIQKVALQIVRDRRIGEHTLPDNCTIIAAGNRPGDRSGIQPMLNALANRFMHYNVIPSFKSWRTWAENNNINPYVLGYLSYDGSKLYHNPTKDDIAYPTPRTWQGVSDLLNTLGCTPEKTSTRICAAIGTAAGAEFIAWCRSNAVMPDIDSIAQGTCTQYPHGNDVLYAVIEAMLNYIRLNDPPEAKIENMARYASKFPPDFTMLFFTDLCSMEPIKARLLKCPAVRKWVRAKNILL